MSNEELNVSPGTHPAGGGGKSSVESFSLMVWVSRFQQALKVCVRLYF